MTAVDQLSYSLAGAAGVTGLGSKTIERAIKSGALRAKKTSENENGDPTGRWVILRSALEQWLADLPDA